MIEDAELTLHGEKLEELLDAWLPVQSGWNLQDAIYLLIRKDPDDQKNKSHRISFAKENEFDYETRALTHLLKSFANPKISIKPIGEKDSTASSKEQTVAIDYRVDKWDFINWAETEWDDNAEHLTNARKRYKKVSKFKKPHKTIVNYEPKNQAHKDAVNELRKKYPWNERQKFTLPMFRPEIGKLVKAKGQTLFARQKLYDYLNQFKAK